MFVSASGLDLYSRPRRYSVIRPETALRHSIVSSDASSLHRAASTASNTSASASSVSSTESPPSKAQHRRSISGNSFHLPKALQPFHRKALSHSHVQGQPQPESEATPRSQPTSPQSPKGPPNRLRRAPPPAHQNKKARSLSQPIPPRSLPTLPLPPPPPPPTRPKQPPPRPRRPSQEELRWKEPLVTLTPAPLRPRRPPQEAPPRKEPSVALPTPPQSPNQSLSQSPPQSPATQWQCSDLVVRCKADVYHVDRTIMCYHSKWFARICAIMRNTKASKNVIDLSADDPDAVAAMMQYCYQLNYDCKSAELLEIDEIADLRPHVDIFMLAERYGISGLKQLALEKFESLAITVLTMNENERHLLKAVRAIYEPSRTANADELRRVAVTICANHVEGFIAGDQTQMALVFESMDELPEFRTDLFEEMALRWK